MDIGWMAERCHVIHSIGDSDGPLPYAPLHIRRTELGTNLRTSFRSMHKSPKLVKPHQPCQVSQRRLCDIHQDCKRYIFQHGVYPGKTCVSLPYAFEPWLVVICINDHLRIFIPSQQCHCKSDAQVEQVASPALRSSPSNLQVFLTQKHLLALQCVP